jgi:cob(I)alamin adenosyltransferase
MVYTSDELKARIEDLQADLLFYLQNQRELSTRSKRMSMVVEKEIEELEEEIKRLQSLL